MRLQVELGQDGMGGYLRAVVARGGALALYGVDASSEDAGREDLFALYNVAYGRLGRVGLYVCLGGAA
jgi:hypothetical protein